MSNINVMVDIETLGTAPNAVIASIGACKFDLDDDANQKITDTFYCTISAQDCVDNYGLIVEDETLRWWSKQNKEAFKALRKDNLLLKPALESFGTWFGPKTLPIWSNGANFDQILLEWSFRAALVKVPWLPWSSRCFRTIKNLIGIKPPSREGTYHNALDDSVFQARHLLLMLKS
jgi:hypothetical protein